MALYQFYLAVIPKSGLLKMHSEIPLEISISTSDGYFKSNTEKYWNKVLINSEEIIQELIQLLIEQVGEMINSI